MSGTFGQLMKNWNAQTKFAKMMDMTFIVLGILLAIDIVLAFALIGISITIDAFLLNRVLKTFTVDTRIGAVTGIRPTSVKSTDIKPSNVKLENIKPTLISLDEET